MAIPKIIHQVWIGKKRLPTRWTRDCLEVKDCHPDWEYKLWRNKDVPALLNKFPKNVRNAYVRYWKAGQWAFACDILRYMILHEYGGVYMDCDFVMVENGTLNILPLEKNLILMNMLKSAPQIPRIQIRLQNCFMASTPQHKFIKRVLDRIDNIDYTLTTMAGLPCDKYNTQYLTTEYSIYLGRPFSQTTGIQKIQEDISNIIPSDEALIPEYYFTGKKAKIATHLYKKTHNRNKSLTEKQNALL
mgnify:CR=1 FL=1